MSDLHSPVRELFRFASMKVALHLQFCSTYKLQGVRRQSFFLNLDMDTLIITANLQCARFFIRTRMHIAHIFVVCGAPIRSQVFGSAPAHFFKKKYQKKISFFQFFFSFFNLKIEKNKCYKKQKWTCRSARACPHLEHNSTP